MKINFSYLIAYPVVLPSRTSAISFWTGTQNIYIFI